MGFFKNLEILSLEPLRLKLMPCAISYYPGVHGHGLYFLI